MRTKIFRWYIEKASHPFKKTIMGRYWWWFASKKFIVKYDKDFLLKVHLRDYLQSKIFFDGYYEPHLIAWIKTNLRSGDVLWDVGANIGAVSLVASRFCQVCSFEPGAGVRKQLIENINRSGVTSVTVVPYALTTNDAEVRLGIAPDSNSGMNSLLKGNENWEYEVVTGRSADSLIASGELPRPTLMKIDVEGAELLVLQGATMLLKNSELRAIVCEAQEDSEGKPKDERIQKLLGESGFSLQDSFYSDQKLADGMKNFIMTRTS